MEPPNYRYKDQHLLKMYYSIAEHRIGEHDAHCMRYKQWIPPVLTAGVIGAYYSPQLCPKLIYFGWIVLLVIFLSEMTVRTVGSILIEYSREIEGLLCSNKIPKKNPGLAHRLKAGPWLRFKQYWATTLPALLRVGAAGPYYLTALAMTITMNYAALAGADKTAPGMSITMHFAALAGSDKYKANLGRSLLWLGLCIGGMIVAGLIVTFVLWLKEGGIRKWLWKRIERWCKRVEGRCPRIERLCQRIERWYRRSQERTDDIGSESASH